MHGGHTSKVNTHISALLLHFDRLLQLQKMAVFNIDKIEQRQKETHLSSSIR